ncbi:aspartyl protease family protein [Pedobacter xixiisoli]|uniref:PDZ domain (Also known as DHR or GLGF) n=1 Tax=Pedobacter xixiisoli TaxID=1476464 RepID=A0A286ADJ1_9SPHI|nr:aspartyl protease family protein [Pedobacter xixiisoli]SOD19976.1 PDZ domain (Also known as DHR or GLGF) [Pedobacter xixiisoli]
MNNGKSNIHLKILCIFIACSSIIASFEKALAQDFKFNNGRKAQSIPFSLTKNLIIIPIYINEKGPFDFILDTGVNPMIVTDSTLKESLKVPFPRAIKISGYGNFEGVDAFLGATAVKIGDAEAENIPTVFLKDDVLPISGFAGRKIYGLIGYNFFNSFLVKVDYTNKSLRFASHPKKIKLKGEKIPFELIENKPYISLTIEQEGLGTKTIKALVDCGASHAISLEALEGKSFPKPQFTMNANLGNGLTGQVNGHIGRISYLKIGNYLLDDVISNYPEYNIDSLMNKGRNANLGAEILSRFNTIYDYQNRLMYIKKNEKFNRDFEHDMSGIELYTEAGPPSRTIINKIEPQSPADLVGLKVGDEIISINFKKIDDYTLDDIGAAFKAKNGYSIVVEVWRNKSTLIKLLKLKKRI